MDAVNLQIVVMAFFIAFLFKTLSTDDNAKKYSGLINMDIPTSKEGEFLTCSNGVAALEKCV